VVQALDIELGGVYCNSSICYLDGTITNQVEGTTYIR